MDISFVGVCLHPAYFSKSNKYFHTVNKEELQHVADRLRSSKNKKLGPTVYNVCKFSSTDIDYIFGAMQEKINVPGQVQVQGNVLLQLAQKNLFELNSRHLVDTVSWFSLQYSVIKSDVTVEKCLNIYERVKIRGAPGGDFRSFGL